MNTTLDGDGDLAIDTVEELLTHRPTTTDSFSVKIPWLLRFSNALDAVAMTAEAARAWELATQLASAAIECAAAPI